MAQQDFFPRRPDVSISKKIRRNMVKLNSQDKLFIDSMARSLKWGNIDRIYLFECIINHLSEKEELQTKLIDICADCTSSEEARLKTKEYFDDYIYFYVSEIIKKADPIGYYKSVLFTTWQRIKQILFH